MNPLPVVHVVEGPPELPPGVGEVLVLRQIDFLPLDRFNKRSAYPFSFGSPTLAMLICDSAAVSIST